MRENIRLGSIVGIAVILGTVLAPVGAQAAGQLFTIVDSNSDAMAQVDGGKLRIGDGAGRLSVDGSVTTRDRAGWNSEVLPLTATAPPGDPTFSTADYTVPAGKKFVITSVSAEWDIWNPSGFISLLEVVTSEGRLWLPARNYSQFTELRRYWIYEELDITVPAGGTIRFEGTRSHHTDTSTAFVGRVVGYLVPA